MSLCELEWKKMLMERAKIHCCNLIRETQKFRLKLYSGHDTVGMGSC